MDDDFEPEEKKATEITGSGTLTHHQFYTKGDMNLTKLNTPTWEIIRGDALSVIPTFAPGTFDAIITDPPYASGGRTQAEKNKSTTQKYSSAKKRASAL